MTTPAPPDSPKSAGEAAEANPWAPPVPDQAADRGEAPGQAAAPAAAQAQATPPASGPVQGVPGVPYWPPYPMAAPQPRNGLGVAAMVLGIVGTVLSLTIILFWMSWIPALLAVIFGAVGLGYVRKGQATNKAMALSGVILGIAGLLVSVGTGAVVATRVHAVNEERRAEEKAARIRSEERVAKEKERVEEEQRRRAADEKARRLAIGQSYTYEDGLKVTLAAPEPYVPKETVFEAPKNATIIQLKVTVVNTGSQDISLYGSGLLFVKDAKGALVFELFDGSGRRTSLPGSLAPGKEATAQSAYALPNDAAAPFTVELDHGSGLQRKGVTWSGSPS
ncbi:DUF4190 domain-containing protein [Kitasatospora camelliae]|uniref:DUF4190 domain-containing protein n=1 Tax=Kitasatospora camelliae TaxID=3156397 RepID=A0AAU8K8D5_9ACTN